MAVFKGSAVAIVTPFKETDQSVNYDAFADIIDYQIDHGTDAIVVCGSTGEAATMSEEEHLQVCKFCIDHVKGRVPVIAGTGSNRTLTAIELSKEVAGYGADGLLLISPYYNKGTQEGVYGHSIRAMTTRSCRFCPWAGSVSSPLSRMWLLRLCMICAISSSTAT